MSAQGEWRFPHVPSLAKGACRGPASRRHLEHPLATAAPPRLIQLLKKNLTCHCY